MRNLSSDWTWFHKFVFPGLWISAFTIVTVGMFLQDDKNQARDGRWFFLGMTIVGATFLYWSVIRLKKVSLDGDRLVVSNYRREIQVPLRDVEKVTGSVMMNPELIWVHFRHPTDFGTKILFMPPTRLWRGFSPHPMAAELRALAESASRS